MSKKLYELEQIKSAATASRLPRKPSPSQGTWAPKVHTTYLQATRAIKTGTLQFFFKAWPNPAGGASSDFEAAQWHRAHC
eukprot:1764375-Pyramimonas_sp.AAC.1